MKIRSTGLTVLATGLMLASPTAGTAPRSGHAARAHCTHWVVWRTGRNGDQVCPHTHSVAADVRDIHLHWAHWGGPVAIGHGQVVEIASGHVNARAATTIRLSRSRRCPGGQRIYTRESFASRQPYPSHGLNRLSCSGHAPDGTNNS